MESLAQQFVFKRRWFFRVWACKMELGQERFGLTLIKNRFATDELILRVFPTSGSPSLLALLQDGAAKQFVFTEGLKVVCREIQGFLTATPDELSW